MIKAAVTTGLAAVAGCWTVFNGHKRLNAFDNRMDQIELHLAKDYIDRSEYIGPGKLEEHMIRIENSSMSSGIFSLGCCVNL